MPGTSAGAARRVRGTGGRFGARIMEAVTPVTEGVITPTPPKAPFDWEKLFGGKKNLRGAKSLGLGILAYMMLKSMQSGSMEGIMAGEQAASMGRMGEAIDPQAMMYQAMLQNAQGDEAMARNQLVNQLMGVSGPSLARGEEAI